MTDSSPPTPGGRTWSTPLLDDQPSTVDLLNFAQFVDALEAIVVNPQTKTPLIIGVFGRWGTGKSTLMQMLRRRVEAKGLITVWFSAWLYNQEQEIWAALLQSLTSTLSRRLTLWQKIRFALGVYERGFDQAHLLYDLPRLMVLTLWVTIPILSGYLISLLFPHDLGRTLAQFGGALGSVGLLFASVIRPAIKSVRERLKIDFSLYRSIDYQHHIGFLDRFREQFARIVTTVPSTGSRVLIFIDDLDRCGPEKALELLDTIKVFLDVPGCVFVLGVDIAVIHRALAKKYPDDPVAQDEYLSKIVQLPFYLPPLTETDLRDYLEGLAVQFPDRRCGDVLLACLSRNPRELKRVINTYALHWYLAQARMTRSDVTPVRLAKVVVIQQGFPNLFAVLRDQPVLLGVLERSIRSAERPDAPGSPDPLLQNVTLVRTAAGVALPASLLPFASDDTVRNLLTMHASAPEDDANFASLSAEELAVYFNLTYRRGNAGRAQGPDSELPPASTLPALDLGTKYLVLERLAFGGSSEVYLAEDRLTKRRVAIKRLAASLSDDPNWSARFEREIRILAALGMHPHIAAVLDMGEGRDEHGRTFAFYVMEHVPGETLQALLVRRTRLPLSELALILGPIFDALGHIHAAGIVHRDVKPSAIVISASGEPKLIDFGLALDTVDGRDHLTQSGFILGTPAYMSPEQQTGQPLGPASDLFSLGVVIFESATGASPTAGKADMSTAMMALRGNIPFPSSVAADVPAALDHFVGRMLAREPTQRFGSATEAKAAFLAAIAAPPQGPE